MSIYLKTRIRYRRSVRTWFGCKECGMYGDYTMPTTDQANAFLERMNELHDCSPALAAAVSSPVPPEPKS